MESSIMMNTNLIILGVVIALIVMLVMIFNKLIRVRNQIENAISSLDALFIKRSDLLPNLITLVKQYIDYESTTLEKVTALRNVNSTSTATEDKQGTEVVKGLMLQLEAYPELKASTQFTHLQASWNEVEEQISAGRRYVSSTITNYNNAIGSFPANIIATAIGMKKREWEYASETQKQNVDAKNYF
ncbi:LemA family protein [Aquimarina algiphila]|uniref:LemA family protein n=1 Tax=Aquimarina algiphila TaxID=2047982 RepID=UPI00232EE368|nr:LemA family protein [Aquimarina algiphila]